MPSDRAQIEELLYLYAERLDAGDFAGVAQLLSNAQIISSQPSHTISGYEAILALYSSTTRRYDNGTPNTQHVVSNVIIELPPDSDQASARSCFTVYQSLPDFPLQAIIAGRYHDRFRRRADGWHFAERRMVPQLFGDLSRHLLIDPQVIQ